MPYKSKSRRLHPLAFILALFLATVSNLACTPLSKSPSSQVSSLDNSGEFFPDPGSQARTASLAMQAAHSPDAQLMQYVADNTVARWFVGGDPGNTGARVKQYIEQAAAAQKIPVLVAYNIPNRDCGQFSAGGANSSANYLKWIDALANGIGSHKAFVILEPDYLPLSCAGVMFDTMKAAVEKLKQAPGARVYIDIGHAKWLGVDEAIYKLRLSGIEMADGFSLNVSNYFDDQQNIAYGQQIRSKLQKNFVIDSSRNGNGPSDDSNWCNPRGRALGRRSTLKTGIDGLDAFIWIKPPGESDGSCGGLPAAGQFVSELALEMARNANRPVQIQGAPIMPVKDSQEITKGQVFTQPLSVGGYSCQQQKDWGKCAEPWMHPVCDAICTKH
ncbi:MAG: glycoside hydrolase family 6 protein [Proteobacteria bacterium]|nr:glycoside hydrolase family 6 protein [Pseudomonadota bacterium]